MKTAILIDGGFYRKRAQILFGYKNPIERANELFSYCISDLKEQDFSLNVSQKGVDMKIGIDISSMAYKKQVEQIILIAGDSDFVPVVKLARREGIDVILDPMGNQLAKDLEEHIDGLHSCVYKFQTPPANQTTFPKIFT